MFSLWYAARREGRRRPRSARGSRAILAATTAPPVDRPRWTLRRSCSKKEELSTDRSALDCQPRQDARAHARRP
eukprot:5872511-Pyramimonas_sp.AAC.1